VVEEGTYESITKPHILVSCRVVENGKEYGCLYACFEDKEPIEFIRSNVVYHSIKLSPSKELMALFTTEGILKVVKYFIFL
jgi:hypothetical protein